MLTIITRANVFLLLHVHLRARLEIGRLRPLQPSYRWQAPESTFVA